MNPSLKVSVITVCYNAEQHIEQAIQSVFSQTYKNIEYLIIDGKSTDGTLSIVNKYRARIDKIISEKDNGIYDAMNKGIQNASGDVMFFLNSDDRFYNYSIVETFVNKFSQDDKIGIVYGKVMPINMPKHKTFH